MADNLKTSMKRIQSLISQCLRRILRIHWPETINNENLWTRTQQTQVSGTCTPPQGLGFHPRDMFSTPGTWAPPQGIGLYPRDLGSTPENWASPQGLGCHPRNLVAISGTWASPQGLGSTPGTCASSQGLVQLLNLD